MLINENCKNLKTNCMFRTEIIFLKVQTCHVIYQNYSSLLITESGVKKACIGINAIFACLVYIEIVMDSSNRDTIHRQIYKPSFFFENINKNTSDCHYIKIKKVIMFFLSKMHYLRENL